MAVSIISNCQSAISVSGLKVGGNSHGGNAKNTSLTSSSRYALSRPLLAKHQVFWQNCRQQYQKAGGILVQATGCWKEEREEGNNEPEEEGNRGPDSSKSKAEEFRQQMERMINSDNARFEGKDLATLIRNKYGRSYDVQLIKKEFMGRQLLAMNVMWKYCEQRSFPLTEEEYLLHLDAVAESLRGWGAVSMIQNSLAKTKEKPRIGKAVSILIDLDETGGRANEWIHS